VKTTRRDRPRIIGDVEDPVLGKLPVFRPSMYEKVILGSSGLAEEQKEGVLGLAVKQGKVYKSYPEMPDELLVSRGLYALKLAARRDVELVDSELKPTEDFEVVFVGFHHTVAACSRMQDLGYKVGFTTKLRKAFADYMVVDDLTPFMVPGLSEKFAGGELRNQDSSKRAVVVGDKHTLEFDVGVMLPDAETLSANSVSSVGVNLEFVHPDDAKEIPLAHCTVSEFIAGVDPKEGQHPGVYKQLRARLREYEKAGISVVVRGLETTHTSK